MTVPTLKNEALRMNYPEGMSPQVRRGLDYFLGLHEATSLSQSERGFVGKLASQLIKSRTHRAYEIGSPEYGRLIKYLETPKDKGGIFNNPNIFGVDCIDGRVLPIYVMGMIAKFGGMIRVPAGDLKDFEDNGGETRLNPNSTFARQLDEAFVKRNTKHITQIFDSHLNCAARKNDEEKKNHYPTDAGLFIDVQRKKEMAESSVRHTNERNGRKKVTPIQISFDPHTGYLYMGLETDYALELAREKGGVFYDESDAAKAESRDFNLLSELARKGKIISTEQLSNDPDVKKFLVSTKVNIDWENHYVRTAFDFWKGVSRLQQTELFKILKVKLARVYGNIPADTEGVKEIEDRATIILANLLNTYWMRKENKKEFPHKDHQERIGVASEGGYSPFSDIQSFGIHILDKENLANNTRLAYNIIRNNRKRPENTIDDEENEPVIMMIQHTVRVGPKHNIWKELSDDKVQKRLRLLPDLPWGKDGNKWMNMNDKQFGDALKNNFGIKNPDLIKELNKLRHAMIALYKDEGPIEDGFPETKEKDKVGPLRNLFPQYKKDRNDSRPRLVLLPVIVDEDRGIQAVLPFMSND